MPYPDGDRSLEVLDAQVAASFPGDGVTLPASARYRRTRSP